MTQTTQNNLSRLVERFLLPALLLVVVYFSYSSIVSIFSLPGSLTVSRGVLLVIPVLIAIGCFFLLFLVVANPARLNRWLKSVINKSRVRRIIELILPTGWLVLLAVSFLPPTSFDRWIAIYLRLSPILLLLFVLDTCLWIYWLYSTRRSQLGVQNLFSGRAGLLVGLLILLIWAVIALTGTGIGRGTQYWGKSGVPIINWQLGVSWLVVFIGVRIFGSRYGWLSRHKDILLFCLLWFSAFLVWQSVPISASRYTTTTYPPNYTNYPFSDAADYALQAELILSGNGFTEGFVDKPLHLTFLACLNWLAGSNFSRMIMFQKAVLAVIPGLVFLVGLRLSGRPAGLLAGLLVMFIQMNNLLIAPRIQSTNVSMTMSEPWTGLMLLFCCLSLINWWKDPKGSLWLPAMAGGVVGLAVLVRLNVMLLIPLVAVIWIFYSGVKKRKTWTSILVFSLVFMGTQIPWGVRNQVVFGDVFKSYMSKTRGVLYKHRIKPVLNESVYSEPTLVPYLDDPAIQKQGLPLEEEQKPANRYASLIDQMLHTGFHNLVTVGMALPVSPYHTGLDQTVRFPYWDQEWDGKIVAGGWIPLFVSLFLMTVGFSRAWKQNSILSVIPGLMIVSYLGANTVSMVSGGRYIVPVDWVLPLYYGIGIWAITSLIFGGSREDEFNSDCNDSNVSIPLIGSHCIRSVGMVSVIGFACLPAVLGLLTPVKQQAPTKMEVLDMMKASGMELPSGISWDTMEEFAQYNESIIMQVKAMFPRWMKTDEGDTGGAGSAFSPLPFDHISFVAIDGESHPYNVVLPVNQQISFLPDASKVFVVGCEGESYIDSVLLGITGEESTTYFRPGTTALTCPLPVP